MSEETIRAQRQKNLLKETATAIASIEARYPEAVERAKQWQPGMMRSAYTMPLEMLVREREHLLRKLGTNPDEVVAGSPEPGEDALPEHIRGAFRRGLQLHRRLKAEHKRQAH